MVKELMHDPLFLGGKSEDAAGADVSVARDLKDTLLYYRETCVGMAANMIGCKKRIIAFLDESGPRPVYTVMFNPEIVEKRRPYQTQEGCLSLEGGPRSCTRWEFITVRYQDEKMKPHSKQYEGWTAQIIQHEVDHCNGILI